MKIHLLNKIIIRDTTLREGLDVPGVERRLKREQRLTLAKKIYELGIREFDIVHPGRVNRDSIWLAQKLKNTFGDKIVIHGAVYAFNPRLEHEIKLTKEVVDEIDFVMPVIDERPPRPNKEKINSLVKALRFLKNSKGRVGVGFANSSQTNQQFLLKISREAVDAGARKIIIYDSIGKFDPWQTYQAVERVKEISKVPILYHCHNDLGLAVANSLFAVYAGATYVDASINGIGDRAGNAALEQLAVIFHLKGIKTGIDLKKIRAVSNLVEKLTGVKKAVNAPIIGNPKIIFSHVSPKHQQSTKSFEIIPLELLGVK